MGGRDAPCRREPALLITTVALWKRAGQEDGPTLTPSAALTNQENHVLSTLQRARYPGELVFSVHGLLVDLKDDIATAQPNIFTERS